MTGKMGLYVSYNEQENGTLDEAVAISNTRGCVTWLERAAVRPDNLQFPTEIIIRISGEEKYYRGILLAVARAETLDENFAANERSHRPAVWRESDNEGQFFRSVLFIGCLREVRRPTETINRDPPQRPIYVELQNESSLLSARNVEPRGQSQ